MSDWFTDEQVEKAALVHYAIDIGFYTATKKVKAIFAALPDDEREEYLIIARAALRAVNPYEWREIDDTARDGSWWWGYWPTEEECDRQCPMRWVEDEQRFVDNADHREFHQPTKYMPLPPSPEGDK